jgi:hypothetical protein
MGLSQAGVGSGSIRFMPAGWVEGGSRSSRACREDVPILINARRLGVTKYARALEIEGLSCSGKLNAVNA